MSDRRMKAFDEPLVVDAVEGEVILLGPDGISGSFTPAAAEESAARLLDAADNARKFSQENITGREDGDMG